MLSFAMTLTVKSNSILQPFGDGLVTVVVPQLIRHGENNLVLWNAAELGSPVHTFSGHSDVILEFNWRSRHTRGISDRRLRALNVFIVCLGITGHLCWYLCLVKQQAASLINLSVAGQ